MTEPTIEARQLFPFTREHYRRVSFRAAELRGGRGWKQREVSHRSGIKPDRLSRIERGAQVRLDELVGLCQAFGIGVGELLFATPPPAEDELERLTREIRSMASAADLAALVRVLSAFKAGLRPGAPE
jgi:transcriptional regulator with XRE-family HTH domain